jgi:hypothetical protein
MRDRDRPAIRKVNREGPERRRLKDAPKLLSCHDVTLPPKPVEEQATVFGERQGQL